MYQTKSRMILYNVTLKVNNDIHEDWVKWMQLSHIKDVMLTGLFVDYRMCRLLGMDDSEGPTYTIQYKLESAKHLETYSDQFAPGLQKDHLDRYGDQVMAFRTVMKIIIEGTPD